MIASNYRKFADALIRQMELDLSGTVGTAEQRESFWEWLMSAGKPQPAPRPAAPQWWKEMKKKAQRLANEVKAATLEIFTAAHSQMDVVRELETTLSK